jgi:F-type H+-transporting ATPase subunit beta
MTEETKKERIGQVVEVIGPVVDVKFKDMDLPEIYNAVRITSEGFETPMPVEIIVEVEQHIGEDKVRCGPCTRPTAWPGA